MDTQNTPIHIKLWHRDFWLMMLATLSLSMGVYMQIPSLAAHMRDSGYESWQVGVVIGIMGLGLFLFGPMCGYWVERYRRCRVCTYALLGAMACMAFLYQVELMDNTALAFPLMCLGRFLFGACYGLAAMVLFSTLIIDMCESFMRTEANYFIAWFARFSLAFGPAISVLLHQWFVPSSVYVMSGLLVIVSFVLVCVIRFPFKAPYDQESTIGLDRFILPKTLPLFISLVSMAIVAGLLLSIPRDSAFYGLMAVGFALAILAEKFAFANANLKSEVLTGLIMIAAVLLLDIFVKEVDTIQFVAQAVLLGMGIGLIGSRYQLFFVKMAKHCQRGTSQSTYLLSWELGICIGLFIGAGVLAGDGEAFSADLTLWVTLIMVVFNLITYNFCIHDWYVRHRNR